MPPVCAPGGLTDLSPSAILKQQEKLVPMHSLHSNYSTATAEGYGDSVDDAPGGDTGTRRRHRHKSRTSHAPSAAPVVDNAPHRRSRGVADKRVHHERVNGKSVHEKREVTFVLTPLPATRPALLIEDRQVKLVRSQLAEHGVTDVGDAAIAEALQAQGGHVGRATDQLRQPATVSADSADPRQSEKTAALVASEVAQTAAVVEVVHLRRRDEAAVRSYIKAFKVEHGRYAAPTTP